MRPSSEVGRFVFEATKETPLSVERNPGLEQVASQREAPTQATLQQSDAPPRSLYVHGPPSIWRKRPSLVATSTAPVPDGSTTISRTEVARWPPLPVSVAGPSQVAPPSSEV